MGELSVRLIARLVTCPGISYVCTVDAPSLEILFCPHCAGVVSWRGLDLDEDGRRRIAVNVRLAPPEAVADLAIDHFDGLVSMDDLPRDGRCVKDMWF